ncbi:MAG: 4-alpha-glucanotransferase [Acidobacteria bacterium]|nr:4-alpha-glucanotransferase [Acidobacteriota bacterium]
MARREFAALERLARRHGVLTVFRDGFKQFREASPETLTALLRTLGAPLEKPEEAPEALRQALRAHWSRFAPPTAVAWEGDSKTLDLRLPEAELSGPLACTLRLEDGRERRWDARLDELPVRGRAELDGSRFVAVGLRLPDGLPQGYHRLVLEAGERHAELRLLSAPARCHTLAEGERPWGVFLPLYALHTDATRGLGDLSDLGALAAWTKDLGGSLVGTLPLLAAFLDEPFEPSPYVPVSRLFWNELYVDPRRTPEWDLSTDAQGLLDGIETPTERLADYRSAMEGRRRVLEALLDKLPEDPSRLGRLREFAHARPELASYAAFRATVETRGETWSHWPARLRDGRLEAGDYEPRRADYHLYVQWLADQQLADLAERMGEPGLYLDLPLGVHASGFDVWRRPGDFAFGVAGGAPPDRFFTKGQNWGFAPLDPKALRGEGLDYWRACLRHHLQHAGVLRLDHFMALHRLYWVPEGMPASEGTYVQYPAEEMYATVCLESVRHRAWIIGEDLGTVPKYVQRRMEERAIDGMYVGQFDYRSEEPVARGAKATSLASMNTHDTPTFAAWWDAKDAADQVELGLLQPGEADGVRAGRAKTRRALAGQYGVPEERAAVLRAALAEMAAGPARAVMVTLEDLWGEKEQQNTPGTTTERPNWRLRAAKSLEEMQADEVVVETLRAVNDARRSG